MRTARWGLLAGVATLLLAATISAHSAQAAEAPQNGSFVIGPDYAVDPAMTDLGAPKGRTFTFKMRLADSRIFRGDDPSLEPARFPVRTQRQITVYVPAGYRDGDRAPVMIMADGIGDGVGLPDSELAREQEREGRRRVLWGRVTNAIDNLTASSDPLRRAPAFVTVAVQNGGSDTKGSQRNLEYDTLSDRYARFIHDEVLPAVLANREIRAAYPRFALTKDPDGRAAFGCSSGGAAALTMGWFRPEWFRRIITYSGTFVENQDEDIPEKQTYPAGAWEYHSGMRLIATAPKKPLRVFTHVSENDNRATAPAESRFNWVIAGRRTAEALQAKGYDNRFVYSLASGHCDIRVYEQTLPDALVWAWKDYSK